MMQRVGLGWILGAFLALGLALGAISGSSAHAGEPAPAIAIGSQIPKIGFKSVDGADQTFADLKGAKGATLVFVRSAKWCPFCQRQLVDLNAIAADAKAKGLPLVAISYDDPAVLKAFGEKSGLSYRLAADPGSKAIKAFGLLDPQYPEGHFAHGVPTPVILIVDSAGVVKARLGEAHYRDRPARDAVLAAIDNAAK